jgi:hypothetical protein
MWHRRPACDLFSSFLGAAQSNRLRHMYNFSKSMSRAENRWRRNRCLKRLQRCAHNFLSHLDIELARQDRIATGMRYFSAHYDPRGSDLMR